LVSGFCFGVDALSASLKLGKKGGNQEFFILQSACDFCFTDFQEEKKLPRAETTETVVNDPHPWTWLQLFVHQSLWLVATHCLAFANLSRLCLKELSAAWLLTSLAFILLFSSNYPWSGQIAL